MLSPVALEIAKWWWSQLNSLSIQEEDETYRTLNRRQHRKARLTVKMKYKFSQHVARLVDERLRAEQNFRIGGCEIGEIDPLIAKAAHMAGIDECAFLFPSGCGTEIRRGVIYVWTRREPNKLILPVNE